MINDILYGQNYESVVASIKDYAKSHIKQSRYEHSERVAEMCVQICKRYGLNEKQGYLAGISHDICKSFSDEDMIKYASKDGLEISDYERKKTALLHGRAAAVILKEQFEIEDEEVLEAVANHTSGTMGMGNITKVLFLADKIEPGRPQSTAEYRERLFKLSLNGFLSNVLIENYEYITKKGYEVYPETKKMVEYYKSLSENE